MKANMKLNASLLSDIRGNKVKEFHKPSSSAVDVALGFVVTGAIMALADRNRVNNYNMKIG